MTAEKILAKYAELLRSAVFICDARFGNVMQGGSSYALAIEGGEAVLTWLQATPKADVGSQYTTQCRRIPVAVLNQDLQGALSWAAVLREQEVQLYRRLKGEFESAAPAAAAAQSSAPIEPKHKPSPVKKKGKRK